jgi:hypothetical protein
VCNGIGSEGIYLIEDGYAFSPEISNQHSEVFDPVVYHEILG